MAPYPQAPLSLTPKGTGGLPNPLPLSLRKDMEGPAGRSNNYFLIDFIIGILYNKSFFIKIL